MKNYIYLLLTLSVFLFSSCVSNNLTLQNTDWKLFSLNKKEISKTTNTNREAHLFFDNTNMSGSSSCNNFIGSYVLDREKVSLSPRGMIMTRMFCQGSVASVESEFVSFLQHMSTYKIMSTSLFFYNAQGEEIAKFTLKK